MLESVCFGMWQTSYQLVLLKKNVLVCLYLYNNNNNLLLLLAFHVNPYLISTGCELGENAQTSTQYYLDLSAPPRHNSYTPLSHSTQH